MLEHVFDVLALSSDAITYLTRTGTVTTIKRLINVGPEWFATAVADGEISKAGNSKITALRFGISPNSFLKAISLSS
jgi:hypothetical protein